MIDKVLRLKDLNGGGTEKLYRYLTGYEEKCAIIFFNVSNWNGDVVVLAKEGKSVLQSIKNEVSKQYKLGYSHLISRWIDTNGTPYDEEALIIYGIFYGDAMVLGTKYNQKSIIVKDMNGCREIVSTVYTDCSRGSKHRVMDVIRTFNLSGDTPLNMKTATEVFNNRKPIPITLKEISEVERPRPSYFQTSYRLEQVYENNVLKDRVLL
ncbi:MAG: hypothetical protein J1F69_01620 [Clostridiales bacterium]|nr:hypothetical protein [Clostridiales bacterium]